MSVLFALYLAVAAFFLLKTLAEGARKRLPWDGYRLTGMALSLAWPAVVLVCAVMVVRDVRAARHGK